MKRFMVTAMWVVAIIFGVNAAANACYYALISLSLDGCTLAYAEVCSQNADGTGPLYLTGRFRFQPSYLCG